MVTDLQFTPLKKVTAGNYWDSWSGTRLIEPNFGKESNHLHKHNKRNPLYYELTESLNLKLVSVWGEKKVFLHWFIPSIDYMALHKNGNGGNWTWVTLTRLENDIAFAFGWFSLCRMKKSWGRTWADEKEDLFNGPFRLLLLKSKEKTFTLLLPVQWLTRSEILTLWHGWHGMAWTGLVWHTSNSSDRFPGWRRRRRSQSWTFREGSKNKRLKC